jgi:RPA family protein
MIRLPAKKLRIVDLVSGKFFSGSKEEMKPSFLITQHAEKVSRVNILATVVDKFLSDDENYGSLTLDDGSEAIRAKFFREKVKWIKDIELGDMVIVIGKVKQYLGEIYINAEVIRKVENVNYESFRKLEILVDLIEKNNMIKELRNFAKNANEEETKKYAKEKFGIDEDCLKLILERKEIDYKPEILKIIESLDEGDGVEIGKILESVNLPETTVEKIISELLDEGQIFEPKPNILKKV